MDPRLRIALRLPTIVFFLLTCWFALLSYVPFAYLQFLRHQLFGWLEFFVVFHNILYWAALLLGLLSVADDLAARRPAAWSVAVIFATFGVWLLFNPMLRTLRSDRRSLIVGLSALTVPLALALIDHLAVVRRMKWDALASSSKIGRGRALQTTAAGAIYMWLTFAAIAAVRIGGFGDGRLTLVDHALALWWSFSVHLAAAAAMFLIVAVLPAAVRSPRVRYLLRMTVIAGVGAFVVARVVCPAIAFRGWLAVSVAGVLGVSGAIIWSGLALRIAVDAPQQVDSDLDIVMMRAGPPHGYWTVPIGLMLLALLGYVVIEGVSKFDWYFLLQKLIGFAMWIAVLVVVYRVDRLPDARRRRMITVAMVGAVMIVSGRILAAGTAAAGRLMLAVDHYAAYNPSLMLIDNALSMSSSELADLTTFLVGFSNVTTAQPASVDFVDSLHSSGAPRPHIFVFVIDSLRRDYLSPYNPAVHFTPAIQAFAAESLTFTRAFTRYGGTGLSEPAIWSGTMLAHKEYVIPFAPMNALEKLVTAENYHRLISVDSILRQLLTPSPAIRELDAGIQNRQYDSCRTFAEIRATLPDAIRDGRPAFVFTQPQDIHLANVALDREQRADDAYAGFYPPYAARLERLDACFGKFIQNLKDTGLYESSVVILTSDHGDSLGDEGRWGHAYTVFPEVIRVPLIVHAPKDVRGGVSAGTDIVAFTTDVTPTLYKLLGYEPRDREPLFGMTLISPDPNAVAKRRQRRYLVASSYGPVYGLVSNNGQELYIVDGVNTAEHRYEFDGTLSGRATTISESERASASSAIREQVLEIARFYSIEPNSN
jgi:hypothetical protein